MKIIAAKLISTYHYSTLSTSLDRLVYQQTVNPRQPQGKPLDSNQLSLILSMADPTRGSKRSTAQVKSEAIEN